jgi:hypothetical protein
MFTNFEIVGLGDFFPRNEPEKWIFILFLLLSVFLFSYVIGVYRIIINKYSNFNNDFY